MAVSDLEASLIEGDYIETVEGLFFAVKGVHHPPDLVIAYLRYAPDPDGERERNGHRYRRLYHLDRTTKFLKKDYTQYLNSIERKALILQSVPRDRIARAYRPRERLVELLSEPRTAVEQTTTKFVKTLIKSDIPLEDLGVSGSTLIGLAQADSDVDIVAYGAETGRSVYEALTGLREKEAWIRPYDKESVRTVARSRWGDTGLDLEWMGEIEARKVLHGLVDGRDYFVRLVLKPDEFAEELASQPLGRVELRADIAGAQSSIYTPCTYLLEGCSYIGPSEWPEASELVSYRGKFTEQASEGEKVEARGTLEKAEYRDRTVFRVMLGGVEDYLVPVRLL